MFRTTFKKLVDINEWSCFLYQNYHGNYQRTDANVVACLLAGAIFRLIQVK